MWRSKNVFLSRQAVFKAVARFETSSRQICPGPGWRGGIEGGLRGGDKKQMEVRQGESPSRIHNGGRMLGDPGSGGWPMPTTDHDVNGQRPTSKRQAKSRRF